MLDEVKIYIRSGDGGDGMSSFRREKFVPRGGPNGGDGGRGGDVIFKVNPKINTFSLFQKKIHFKADRGGRGGSNNKTGANANDMIVEVPPGTVVRHAETGAMMADLVKSGDSAVLARGGRGGRGNSHFKSSSRQAPYFAEKGAPGEEHWLILELKLIADVGLVGVPNAGKSTLLSVISNARPKIADYPFTTLEPNLGVVTIEHSDLVVADIPGLIEGAHQGIGLGHSFLRHVQRTRLLVHLLDGASEHPMADYSQINSELALYDERLGERPQIVVFTKMDLPEAQAQWSQVEASLKERGVEAMAISSATHQNTRELVQRMFQVIADIPESEALHIIETPVYELPEAEIPFTIEHVDDGIYRVGGYRIERAAAMTYWDNEEAIMRFQSILETLGISDALTEAGVETGDTVFIGEHELEWSE